MERTWLDSGPTLTSLNLFTSWFKASRSAFLFFRCGGPGARYSQGLPFFTQLLQGDRRSHRTLNPHRQQLFVVTLCEWHTFRVAHDMHAQGLSPSLLASEPAGGAKA